MDEEMEFFDDTDVVGEVDSGAATEAANLAEELALETMLGFSAGGVAALDAATEPTIATVGRSGVVVDDARPAGVVDSPDAAAVEGAWRDADDEAVRVNIAAKKRTRKLRQSKDDIVVNGAECVSVRAGDTSRVAHPFLQSSYSSLSLSLSPGLLSPLRPVKTAFIHSLALALNAHP